MHPADAIIDRVEELLRAAIPGARIEAHRTTSLSDEQIELPAGIITMGSDDPASGFSTFDDLGSLLTFTVSWIDKDTDERKLAKRLLDYRLSTHRTLMARGALGFPWVIEVGYLGANPLITDPRAQEICKDLTTKWQVAYMANRADPTVTV